MARGSRLSWMRSKRYGVIDVGTNSSLLLLVEAHQGSHEFTVLYDDVEITQLGRGFYATNRLQNDAMERTAETIRNYLNVCDDHQIDDLIVTGTSVLRDAENGGDFLDLVKERFGIAVEVISGEMEARLSYIAVRRDGSLPIPANESCLVTDIGGGSTELILGDDKIRQMASLNVGAVRLTEAFLKDDPPSTEQMDRLREHLGEMFLQAPRAGSGSTLVGVGGTITTLANIAAHERQP
ncbi:MAG: Ppx/GppA family phosphatase, partial [Candidatus Poribacteria bacterium]|nr:Ppx/GppA family phosphatase [Candidatus Poribacteria bacterium]